MRRFLIAAGIFLMAIGSAAADEHHQYRLDDYVLPCIEGGSYDCSQQTDFKKYWGDAFSGDAIGLRKSAYFLSYGENSRIRQDKVLACSLLIAVLVSGDEELSSSDNDHFREACGKQLGRATFQEARIRAQELVRRLFKKDLPRRRHGNGSFPLMRSETCRTTLRT